MQLIHDHLHEWNSDLPRVPLRVARGTLAKRRWRCFAEDGAEFGFDLEHPLEDGDVFHQTATAIYFVEQQPEPVLELRITDFGFRISDVARLGWMIGNLHFPLAIEGEMLHVVDDPALRQLFDREKIAFSAASRLFKPLGIGHAHSHEHHHH